MIKLAHVVNPFKAKEGSESFVAQPITFESMKRAQEFAKEKVEVELLSVSFSEDHEIIPDYFSKLPDLERSVLNILDLSYGYPKRKLPFIKDILQSAFDNSSADWLIYTNSDIALMPSFYETVASFIAEGNDAILINRRRISKDFNQITQLSQMYASIGGSHPGYDCFVFHRSLFPKMILDDICIGVPFIEVSLLHNLIAFATNLKHADNLHLTFHIGMEVMPPIEQEYYWHNRTVYEKNIKPFLLPHLALHKFPYSSLPFYKRMFKWMLNPCYSTALMADLEGKDFSRKCKMLSDEIRWRILSK
jgi:hypothetical protein